mgnify:CR=1 FL=1
MELTPRNNKVEQDGDTEIGLPRLGDWYWVKTVAKFDGYGRKAGDTYEWLGCVMLVGSNFVELHSPRNENLGGQQARVHIDELDEVLRFEPEPERIFAERVAHFQGQVNTLIQEVAELTSRLGLTSGARLTSADAGSGESRALATLSGTADVKGYENALMVAKNETLPDYFKRIEIANKELARWLKASAMPLIAQMGPMKQTISAIDGRIFNISLYAGLTENVERICDGEPAAMEEKLHVMQRRLYMDEECLLAYEKGGMQFKDIAQFDAWLSKPSNRDRILPFPRTLVAMRVRRTEMERDDKGDLLKMFINFQLRQTDKATFLFIRNGDQIWRMNCDMDFGELIFPDVQSFEPGEPMMVKMFAGSVDKLIPRRRYDHLVEQWTELERLSAEWKEANPGVDSWSNPHRRSGSDRYLGGLHFNPSDWEPFDFSNVYYDEAMEMLAKQVREYNRIALIIQGLFDRSEALHPHPPVQSWTAEGFERAIKLIYDANTLYEGEKPDFEAYRDQLNASLDIGSIVAGGDDYWARKEAEKENRRLDNDWRSTNSYRHKRFRPLWNPGPGLLAEVRAWNPRRRTVTLNWLRRSIRNRWDPPIAASISVPASELLNVSAYRPGDYLQFFRDPRTRAEYLKWAPLMLAAEDFHAGLAKVGSNLDDD